MKKYIRKVPLIVEAKQITENGFDGHSTFCAHCLKNLIVLDERFLEKEYENSDFRCEYEDDGYCLNKNKCKHQRIIGYIKTINRCHYLMPTDYILKDENGKIAFMRKEKFEELFEILKE